MERPAIFFDRDNTLIANDGYLGDPAGVILIDGAADAVARARSLGYAVVTFSNQSGVARGLFTEEAVHAVNSKLDEMLQDQNSQALIDRHEFCPYHPGAAVERYRRDSDLRKPKPGMLLQAADRLEINLERSWVIGDAPRDVEAGKAAGCRTILFKDRSLAPSPAAQEAPTVMPDFAVASLREALDIIAQASDFSMAMDIKAEASVEPKAEENPAPPASAAETPAVESAAAAAPATSAEGSAPSAATASAAEPAAAAPAPPAKPRKMTFAERVRAGTFQPARVAAAAGAGTEKEKRVAPILDAPPAAAPENHAPAARHGEPPAESDPDLPPPVRPTQPLTTAEQLEPILQNILDELRMARQDKPQPDFSVIKLLTGITQVLVLPALFFGYLHRDSAPDLQSMMLLAIFLQTLTIALIMMGR